MMALATTSKIQTNKIGLDRATQEILKNKFAGIAWLLAYRFKKVLTGFSLHLQWVPVI